MIYYESKEGFDVIDFAQAYDLNYCRGAILKYIVRAGKKPNNPELQDLRKAMDYLSRELNYLEEKQKQRIDEDL